MFDYDTRPVTPGVVLVDTDLAASVYAADDGMRRIYEYSFPLEVERARRVLGVPSAVNNVLIINRVSAPDRITAILVNLR